MSNNEHALNGDARILQLEISQLKDSVARNYKEYEQTRKLVQEVRDYQLRTPVCPDPGACVRLTQEHKETIIAVEANRKKLSNIELRVYCILAASGVVIWFVEKFNLIKL